MKLIYQYMAIFFNFSPTSNHLHPLQVENCDSNSRLVVDEDDNGKFRLETVKDAERSDARCRKLSISWQLSMIFFLILQPSPSPGNWMMPPPPITYLPVQCCRSQTGELVGWSCWTGPRGGWWEIASCPYQNPRRPTCPRLSTRGRTDHNTCCLDMGEKLCQVRFQFISLHVTSCQCRGMLPWKAKK